MLLMHLIHGSSWSLLRSLGDHIYFVHVNCARGLVYDTLDGDAVSHVIPERVGIVDVKDFVFHVVDKNHVLTGLKALVAAGFVTDTGAFGTAFQRQRKTTPD